ncbi:MAG: hypothetical protein ABIG95_00050 [Candidatus Woesearchaeota archaeon]
MKNYLSFVVVTDEVLLGLFGRISQVYEQLGGFSQGLEQDLFVASAVVFTCNGIYQHKLGNDIGLWVNILGVGAALGVDLYSKETDPKWKILVLSGGAAITAAGVVSVLSGQNGYSLVLYGAASMCAGAGLYLRQANKLEEM